MEVDAGARIAVHAAVAVVTPKDEGQDRAAVLTSGADGTDLGIAICDGVGAYEDSGVVAARCLDAVTSHVAEHGAPSVLTCATAAAGTIHDDATEGATTLIALAVDRDGHAYWTLVGNGSVFELEAADVRGGAARLAFAELAIPHVSFEGGRPGLRSTLRAKAEVMPEVSAGMLLPRTRRMRALLACSDGIATQEDWREGTSRAGATLREIPPPLVVLLARLGEEWTDLEEAEDPQGYLGALIEDTLDELLTDGALADDASVGVVLLVSPAP
jgi:hypothetical protein